MSNKDKFNLWQFLNTLSSMSLIFLPYALYNLVTQEQDKIEKKYMIIGYVLFVSFLFIQTKVYSSSVKKVIFNHDKFEDFLK